MTIADFVKSNDVRDIQLWPTKEGFVEGKHPAFAGKAITANGRELSVISSVKGFTKDKPVHVYTVVVDDIDQKTGEILGKKDLHVLSNNEGKAPTLNLKDLM